MDTTAIYSGEFPLRGAEAASTDRLNDIEQLNLFTVQNGQVSAGMALTRHDAYGLIVKMAECSYHGKPFFVALHPHNTPPVEETPASFPLSMWPMSLWIRGSKHIRSGKLGSLSANEHGGRILCFEKLTEEVPFKIHVLLNTQWLTDDYCDLRPYRNNPEIISPNTSGDEKPRTYNADCGHITMQAGDIVQIAGDTLLLYEPESGPYLENKAKYEWLGAKLTDHR